jgi:ABC-type Mn2+/Zn2+ transport system ATPase subunit
MSSLLVRAKGLDFGPKRDQVLVRNLSFELWPGQILWIAGPNGVGKSTLLRVILGQGWIKQGSLERFVPMADIGYLPQLQNRKFHLPVTLWDVIVTAVDGRVTSADIARIGLLQPAHLRLGWNTASGGERKRTLLTRVLMQDPSLLVLDEPLGHLDSESYALVINAIDRFLNASSDRSRAKGVMVVEHGALPEALGRFDVAKVILGPASDSTAA